MSDEWHLVENGEEVGPYSTEQVRRRLAGGLISPDTLTCRVGDADWTPIGSVAEFVTPQANAAQPSLRSAPLAPAAPAAAPRLVVTMPGTLLTIPSYGGLRIVSAMIFGLGLINAVGGLIAAFAMKDSIYMAVALAVGGSLSAVVCFALANLLSVAADVGVATTRTANAVEVLVRQRL
jgi:hypothetical protein